MKTIRSYYFIGLLIFSINASSSCRKNITGSGGPYLPLPTPADNKPTDVSFWLTRADKLALFTLQNNSLIFKDTINTNVSIEVDSTTTYQSIDGFGGCLTGGSAYLVNKLPASKKDELLNELFTTDSTYIGISYIRISIGASDLSRRVFSYNDMPPGQTDTTLANFNLSDDLADIVPVLQKIIALNPTIKILASPWSAPVWMKTNGSSIGGSLKPEFYSVYAKYFVKYIQAMKALGITIDAITVQNEPLNPFNNPSMVMQATEQLDFIKNHLGPAFLSANITAKIIINENNPDIPDYPIAVLNDPVAKQFTDGSAFHLYGGDISGLSIVHNAHPDKNIYFTEQWVGAPGDFQNYLAVHIKYLIIGATRNWSRNVLEWNLAADENNNPHTTGGCTMCLGSITITTDNTITRNVGYYIIAHVSKFVRPGSVRIASSQINGLPNVAFKTPNGKKVLIVLNDSQSAQNFNIRFNNVSVTPVLPAGAVGTYIW